MSSNSAQGRIDCIGQSNRDHLVRDYVDRHCGVIVCLAMLFAIASCFGLVLVFGLYAAIGGNSTIVIALGLSLWLLLNGWAIHRFMLALRIRASAEWERLRFGHLKPVQQNG